MSELDRMAQYMIDGQFSARSFNIRTGDTLTVDITRLNEAGKTMATWALEAWTNVSGINFEFVSSNAQITFDDVGEEGTTPDANITMSGRFIESVEINIPESFFPAGRYTLSSFGFYTYLHELGHALGLYHPGPYSGGSARYGVDNVFQIDSYHTTVMSYFSQEDNTDTDASMAYPVTPMIADIIAIQMIYGAPNNINLGDTVYGYGSNVQGYMQDYFRKWIQNDLLMPPPGLNRPTTFTIYDNGGNDTLDLRTDTNPQIVDLNPGGSSSVFGYVDNVVIARDTGIDNFVGGSANDQIIGNPLANRLEGREGDDKLWGKDGNDILIGGSGTDRLQGGEGADVFLFQAAGGNGLDTVVDFELGIDIIRIEPGNLDFGPDDVWYVNTDNGDLRVVMDTNSNGQRDDEDEYITLSGISAGFDDDDIDFVGSTDTQPEPDRPPEPTPDSVNEITGTAGNDKLNGTAGNDTINAGRGEDRLWGDDGDDKLYGDEGNDVLEGGAGADTLDGGIGDDYAYYLTSNAGVIVRLHSNVSKFGHAEGDKLINIEHLEGSEHNDILAGDGKDNLLSGGAGDDVLYGGPAGGDDMMYGGDGDDRVFGGKGSDRITGGKGNDFVKGGPGDDIIVVDGDDMDILYGGPDSDRFQFFPSKLGGGSIRDFTDGEDVIDLTEFTNVDSIDDLDW